MMPIARSQAKFAPVQHPLHSLPLLVAVLAMTSGATLRGGEDAPSPVSLERPGYGAITLRSPSHRSSDQPSSGSPRDPEGTSDAAESPAHSSGRSSAMPLVTIGSSLAVVLGLFAALVWVTKKTGVAAPRGGVIPDEALRLLGQKSLGASGSIALLRCGRSVLVVGISAAGMQPLSEITDQEQVRNLESLCLGDSAASFQAALGERRLEVPDRGFAGDQIGRPQVRKKLFSDR